MTGYFEPSFYWSPRRAVYATSNYAIAHGSYIVHFVL